MENHVACSIVIPVYYNAASLAESFAEIYSNVIKRCSESTFEVIFIDDGSGDDSLSVLQSLYKRFPDIIRIIRLSRNFGQVAAIFAGLKYSRGESVIIVSADGQDPPDVMLQMLEARSSGREVIIACRGSRDEGLYRTLTSRLFYWLMRKLTFPNMPKGGFDYLCISARATKVLLRNSDAHPFLQGQILWLGFNPMFIEYRRRARKYGRSRWSFARKLTYLLDGVLSYSYIPLRGMSLLGGLFAMSGFGYAVVIFVFKLRNDIPVEGWAPLMIILLIIGGIQMIMLGLIGEYLWRALAQCRNRDNFIVEQTWPKDVAFS